MSSTPPPPQFCLVDKNALTQRQIDLVKQAYGLTDDPQIAKTLALNDLQTLNGAYTNCQGCDYVLLFQRDSVVFHNLYVLKELGVIKGYGEFVINLLFSEVVTDMDH